jgi:hypothetical protein
MARGRRTSSKFVFERERFEWWATNSMPGLEARYLDAMWKGWQTAVGLEAIDMEEILDPYLAMQKLEGLRKISPTAEYCYRVLERMTRSLPPDAKLDHEAAYREAQDSSKSSNLARCYIDLVHVYREYNIAPRKGKL